MVDIRLVVLQYDILCEEQNEAIKSHQIAIQQLDYFKTDHDNKMTRLKDELSSNLGNFNTLYFERKKQF